MNVIVIGGGASGLAASIYASKNNNVILLEKNQKCGKKISITGNGKCNFLNDDFSIKHYHSKNIDMLKKYINNQNKDLILNFMTNIGVEYYEKEGYYYPLSNQATTVQNALIKEAIVNNVKIEYEAEVLNIKKDSNFIVETDKGLYYADKVIIASGSKATPKTGSDGKLYQILKNMKHEIVNIKPALVQLKTKEVYKDLIGVRTYATLNLDGIESTGELQFTNYGLSGICTLNLSGRINKNSIIKINLIPRIDNIIKYLDNKNNIVKQRNITDLLDGLLNYKIVNEILKLAGIKNDELWENIDIKRKKSLENYLTNLIFTVLGTKDYTNAQVCSGGVSLTNITDYFESRIVDGLYIVGEILDVDGECGGYNLGFAFLSGMIAGSSLKGENND